MATKRPHKILALLLVLGILSTGQAQAATPRASSTPTSGHSVKKVHRTKTKPSTGKKKSVTKKKSTGKKVAQGAKRTKKRRKEITVLNPPLIDPNNPPGGR